MENPFELIIERLERTEKKKMLILKIYGVKF